MSTLKTAPSLYDECTEDTHYWIDFFTLRQCQPSAFVPQQIAGVMSTMDACLVEIDKDSAYLGRTFCIFEAFAAINAGVELRCAPKAVMEEVCAPMCPCDHAWFLCINVHRRCLYAGVLLGFVAFLPPTSMHMPHMRTAVASMAQRQQDHGHQGMHN